MRRVAVREPSRQTTFRVVVAVVVALLLTNFLIVVYFVHPAFNPEDDEGDVREPDPEGDWLVAIEPVRMTESETWIGEDIVLERPVVVTNGTELLIRDSHVRIHLEDLIFWLEPAFMVETGASLVIEDSTVEVYQYPRTAASVVGAYTRPDHHVPYMARVVNLDNAVDPVLHFDVRWRANETPVGVGVIPEGSEDMLVHSSFTFGGRAPWHHMEVGLSDYVGTRPWVVLWLDSYPEGPVFIGNLSVKDGNAWPPGDAFPTGHPIKDGWLVSRFADIPYIQRMDFSRGLWYGLQRSWQPLIDARGDVTIEGSTVTEPPGMGRKASGDVHKEAIDPEEVMRFDQVGAHGGHIRMVEGTLSVASSELVNVPITGLNTTLSAQDTTFRGDHDLVSLHRPSGTISECTFLTDPLTPDNPFNSYSYRYLWALGVEGTSGDGPLVVRDNTFTGNHMAIDLSHADVQIGGNTFSHIIGMAVWDHMSKGASWDQLDRTNTFRDLARNAYLHSTVTDVEFVHPDNETGEIQVHTTTSIQTWLPLYGPFGGNLQSILGNQIRYIVPRTLVRDSGEVRESRVVHADVVWNYQNEYFTFSPSDSQLIIDLSQLFPDQPPEEPTLFLQLLEVSQGATQDELGLSIQLKDVWTMDQGDPTMRFTVDGELAASIPLTFDLIVGDDAMVVNENLALAAGWHDLDVSVWGRELLEGGAYATEPTLLASMDRSLLLLSQANDIEPWMPLEADVVVVPQNVTARVDLGEPREPPEREFDTVRVVGWNGSRLLMDGSDLEGRARTNLYLVQNVSLELENARFSYLEVSEERWSDEDDWWGAPVSLHNVSAGILGVDGLGREIRLSELEVSEYLGVGTNGMSKVSLSRSVVDDGYASLDMWNGTMLIEDCTFRSNWSDSIYLRPAGADLTVRNCTFSGASLMVFFDNWYWWAVDDINITGCTFSGEDALLYVGWDILHVDTYDVDPDFVPQLNGTIEGNTFSGEGSAAVLHHGTFGQVWGDNQLLDGARLYAMYITRLQVIPPDGTPFWGAYDFVPTEGMVADWPFGIARWMELDGELLYDVTGDISKETDPPTLDVVLYSLGTYRYVRGFAQVVPNADNDEATYPVMPDLPGILWAHVVHWPPLGIP